MPKKTDSTIFTLTPLTFKPSGKDSRSVLPVQTIGNPGVGDEDARSKFRIGVQLQIEFDDMIVFQLLAGFS